MTCFRFGVHELDLARYELRVDGTPVKIDPKAFDALRVLAERADNLVTKEELLQQLWPGETVVEGAVHSTIARARRALGQRGGSSGAIATVHGRGYRFVAPLERIGEPASVAPAATAVRSEALPADEQFVGREQALGTLVQRIHSSDPGLWWIEGEAGIGKTRLCEEVARQAADAGALTLWGRSFESLGSPAFWPFRRLVQAVSQAAPKTLTALPAPWRQELSKLRPGAEDHSSNEPPPDDSQAGRFRLFEAVGGMLREVARHGFTIIVIDDVHWADEPSLSLLEYLASEQQGAPYMLLLTYRTGGQDDESAVEQARQRIARKRSAHVVRLSGLTEEEIAAWLGRAGEAPNDDEVVRALHAKTGGNPLFLGESLRSLPTSSGPLRAEDVANLSVPEGVRGLLRGRLASLPRLTLELLRQASTLGSELDPAVLSRATGTSVHDVREALKPALAAGVVRPTHDEGLCFTHDLWQATLYTEQDDRQRSAAHLAAAHALQADPLGAERHARELAHHYLAAAPSAPLDDTLHWCQVAAERASRSHGYEDAARLLERALMAVRLASDVDPEVIAELQLARGRALEHAGRTEEAWQQLSEVVERSRARADVVRMARAALVLRPLHVMAVTDEKLRAVLSEVETKLPGHARPLRARVCARLAMQAPMAISMEKRAERAASALALLDDCDDPATLIDVYAAQLHALQGPHQIAELDAACAETLELAHTRGLDGLIAEVHAARYLARLLDCDRAGALREWESFGRLADRLRDPIYKWHHERCRSYQALYAGRFTDAAAAFRSLYRSGQRLHPWLATLFHRAQINALIRLSEDPSSYGHIEAYEMLTRYGWAGGNLDAAVMLFYAETGRTRTAREGMERLAARDFADVPMALEYVAMLGNLAELADRLDDLRRAEMLYALLEPHADRNSVSPLGLYDGVGAFYLGLLARKLGRAQQAIHWFQRALELHERMQNLPYLARTQVELAITHQEMGDAAQARHWAQVARPTVTALSLKPLANRLKRLNLP